MTTEEMVDVAINIIVLIFAAIILFVPSFLVTYLIHRHYHIPVEGPGFAIYLGVGILFMIPGALLIDRVLGKEE